MTTWAEYQGKLAGALDGISGGDIARAVELLRQAGTVYVVGNGGSNANADHLVLHLREVGRRAFNLMGDVSTVTAFSNDYSYEVAVLAAVRRDCRQGDALVVISGSGNSSNVILGVVQAQAVGIPVVGLLGMGGGACAQMCSVALVADSTEYGPIEDAHSALIHWMKSLLLRDWQ